MELTVKNMNLTPRQMQVLEAVAGFQKSKCYSMTIQEVAESLGVGRTTAYEHIAGLKEKGLLSASPGKGRSLKLTARAQRLLEAVDGFDDSQVIAEAGRAGGIPMLGRVAAGVPIEAIENAEEISLRSEFGTGDDVFALQVAGDSMIDDGVYDGDTVICRRRQTAENGQMVVAIVDDDNATVKRFYQEDGMVRLEPANENYEPIYTQNCRIAGIVTGLMRKLL